MTSDAAGLDVDLGATMGRATDDSGVPHGRMLIDFAEAVVRGDDDLARLRTEVVDRLGPDRAGHAVATITAFSGLVRVADATGIPIDDGLASVSVDTRQELALEQLGGAANSRVDHVERAEFGSIDALFDNS